MFYAAEALLLRIPSHQPELVEVASPPKRIHLNGCTSFNYWNGKHDGFSMVEKNPSHVPLGKSSNVL